MRLLSLLIVAAACVFLRGQDQPKVKLEKSDPLSVLLWLHEQAAPVREVETNGNDFAYERAEDRLRKSVARIFGHPVRWELLVDSVEKDGVRVSLEINGPPDRQHRNRRLVLSVAGKVAITDPEWAEKLRRGDQVPIAADIHYVQYRPSSNAKQRGPGLYSYTWVVVLKNAKSAGR